MLETRRRQHDENGAPPRARRLRPETSFTEGDIAGVVFRPLRLFEDERGWLSEVFRHDELPPSAWPQMAYATWTRPGVTRGPHEHTHQTDLMAFLGPGDVELYLWDARSDSSTTNHRLKVIVGETNRQVVTIPPGVVHAFRNRSDHAVVVYNFPDRLYAGQGRQDSVDEIRHEDRPQSSFVLD